MQIHLNIIKRQYVNIVKKNNIDIEKLTEEDLKPFMVGYMKENHHNLLTDE